MRLQPVKYLVIIENWLKKTNLTKNISEHKLESPALIKIIFHCSSVLLLHQGDQCGRSLRVQRSRLRLPAVGHGPGPAGLPVPAQHCWTKLRAMRGWLRTEEMEEIHQVK
jgi:hypothetical protein